MKTTREWLIGELKKTHTIIFDENEIMNLPTESSYGNIDRKCGSEITLYCTVHKKYFKLKISALFSIWYQMKGEIFNPCPDCRKEKRTNKVVEFYNNKMNERFFEEAKKVHNNFYSYEKVDILNRRGDSKIIITCPIHGDFKMTAGFHLRGEGCPKCASMSHSNVQYRLYNILKEKYPEFTIHLEYKAEWFQNQR